MTNLLVNGGFEQGWDDLVIEGRLTQVPKGWTVGIAAIGAPLASKGAFDFDHTPVLETVRTIPEILHKPDYLLPIEERLGGPRALILDGTTTFKLFSNYSPYSVDLYQMVSGLTPVRRVRLTAPIQVHYQPKPGGDDSPGACAVQVYIDATETPWLTYGAGITDRTWQRITLEATVGVSGVVLVGATFESRSEAGIDFFTDAWELTYIDAPNPEPACRGLPRGGPGGYVRTVNVIPQDATQERAAHIFAMAWSNGRQTVTGSYDDAGIGDLTEKTAVLWDIPTAEQSQYLEFYQQYYPGTRVVFQGDSGGTVEPEPPSGGEPTQYPDPGVLIGLHSQRTKDGWLDYYRRTKAAVFKGFTVAQCVAAKQASPETLVVFRRHVDNDGAYINAPDLVASARALLDLYAAEFAGYSASSGMSVSDILKHIDVLESVNEVIGTHDPELEPSVAFDCAFADLIRLRYGHQVSAGLLTVAVGNPHESEVVKLLPAARKAYEDGHYIGYHPYWSANTERSWLAEKWQWHAGRWCEWDRVFTAHGVYPRYYGGESGICFAPDGDSFQASRGWKSCGAFGKYITDLVLFDRLARAWNVTHGNRFRGAAVFCYGGWGWEDFDFEPGDLAELAEALA